MIRIVRELSLETWSVLNALIDLRLIDESIQFDCLNIIHVSIVFLANES